jgi:uncharacterized protein with HEPN domain
MLLISEAAMRLGDEAERLCPEQPWRDIRGLGNWLRHQYDKIDVATIWHTFENDLPSLKAAVFRALDTALNNPSLRPDEDLASG